MMLKQLLPALGFLTLGECIRRVEFTPSMGAELPSSPTTDLEGRIELPSYDSDEVIYPEGVQCQAYFYGEPVDNVFKGECAICPNGKGGTVDKAWANHCKETYPTIKKSEWEFEVFQDGRCTMYIPDGYNIMKDWGCQAMCRLTNPKFDYGCGCGVSAEDCYDVDCEMTEWSDWSDCMHWDSAKKKNVKIKCDADAPLVNGHHTRTRTVKVQQAYGGAECPADTETRSCNSHTCVDIDCVVSEWSEWSGCTKKCSGGEKTRTRTVTQQPQDNGASCPALSETTACNTDFCYYFKLKGKSGSEQVLVVDGENLNPSNSDGDLYTLDRNWKTIGTNSQKVSIYYKNDNSSRDVVFKYAVSPSGLQSIGFQPILTNTWTDWKCGKDDENKRCERVRDGYFCWKGVYGIVFI